MRSERAEVDHRIGVLGDEEEEVSDVQHGFMLPR